MDSIWAAQIARMEMLRHGLNHWTFEWSRSVTVFGLCVHSKRTIRLSEPLVKCNDEAKVRDTILHEIAHALTPGARHGPVWQAKCVEIGAIPKACCDAVAPVARWLLYCVKCKYGMEYYRRSNRAHYCKSCTGTMKFITNPEWRVT